MSIVLTLIAKIEVRFVPGGNGEVVICTLDVHFTGPHTLVEERDYVFEGGERKMCSLQKLIQIFEIGYQPPLILFLFGDGKYT